MNRCPICEGVLEKSSARLFGVISPWVREMAEVRNRRATLNSCDDCQGAFFTYRYQDTEMNKLYSDYRSENYVSTRSRWEPWYSSNYNQAHLDSDYSQKRKTILLDFLTHSGIGNIRSIVDVGGNIGEFIPEIVGLQEKYVLEISKKELPKGIQRILSMDEVGVVDLVIYAHVLEHVANPFLEFKKLMQSCKYLYVEVPNGVPTSNIFRKYQLFQLFYVILSLSEKTWGYFSRPSAGRKVAASLLRQSEHLSFFSEKTFKVIAEKQGLEVSTRVTKIITPDMQDATVIQALFSQR